MNPIRARLVALLSPLRSSDPKTRAALDLLRGWDGVERAESAPAAHGGMDCTASWQGIPGCGVAAECCRGKHYHRYRRDARGPEEARNAFTSGQHVHSG